MRRRDAMLGLTLLASTFCAEAWTQTPAARLPVYTVVSVKENRSKSDNMSIEDTKTGFKATNADVVNLLGNAFDLSKLTEKQIVGLPAWTKSTNFDVEGKIDPEEDARFHSLNEDESREMLRVLLADRFGLAAHFETHDGPVYSLIVGRKGVKLTPSKPAGPDDKDHQPGMMMNSGRLEVQQGDLKGLAFVLTHQTGRPVEDRTGLTGQYDYKLLWTPEAQADTAAAKAEGTGADAPPPLFTALEEQLGLRLEPGRGPVQTLVIDHIQMPAAN